VNDGICERAWGGTVATGTDRNRSRKAALVRVATAANSTAPTASATVRMPITKHMI